VSGIKETGGVAATPSQHSSEREFLFTERDFKRIRDKLYDYAGIALSDYKKDMAYNRLVRRLRELKLNSFREYFEYLDQEPDEFSMFINSMTTNLTAFFREKHHFDFLAQEIIPGIDREGGRRMRVWSAGCSMGEEPYSLAMTMRSGPVNTDSWDMKILATDIDSKVLDCGQAGIYSRERIEGLEPEVRNRWFLKGKGKHHGQVKARRELQQMISFRELNLMHNWPIKGPLDVIFCRNVMIYFDHPTQARLLDRMADLLKPNGYLFVGHSESPFRLTDRFKLVGKTIYRKVD